MKFIIGSILFAVLLVKCEAFLKPINPGNCIINPADCSNSQPVCGRFGGSDLCHHFANQCDYLIANCRSKTPYYIVDEAMCANVPFNTRTFCTGLGTTANVNTGLWNKPLWNKPLWNKPLWNKPLWNQPGVYLPTN